MNCRPVDPSVGVSTDGVSLGVRVRQVADASGWTAGLGSAEEGGALEATELA